jgi:16S rRNA G966 N2-methylase RsmD
MLFHRSLPSFYRDEIAESFDSFRDALYPCRPEDDNLSHAPREPLLREIRGVKSTSVYLAHSYPTKVPPEAIIPYIEHYTRPGDVVLDPFAGSGMTGVAARYAGRHVLLNDLSVGAAHLAYNHCTPCDPAALHEAFHEIAVNCEGEFRWLYRTRCDGCGGPAEILYMLWSDVLACASCRRPIILWDVGVDKESGTVAENIRCPKCRKTHPKRALSRHGPAVPALTDYQCLGTCSPRRRQHRPTAAELQLIAEVSALEIPYSYPDLTLDQTSEMYIRCALHLQRIEKVSDFYTARNLRALAKIWREILLVPEPRVRSALAFGFTNTAWHATKMRRFNARGGQRPLTGTLYVPQLSIEANPFPILEHKIKMLANFYRELGPAAHSRNSRVVVRLGCATNIHELPDNSVDYVFTDPPFGSNIFYADLNLIWESWLGRVTHAEREAVINRSKKDGKSLDDYYQLMKGAFTEMHRVLKPERWASVVFHNSDDEVWQAIQTAAEEAGFILVYAGGIDKSKRSMRGYIARRADEDIADGDVVLNLRKSRDLVSASASQPLPEDFEKILLRTISGHLRKLGRNTNAVSRQPRLDPRSMQYVHGLAVRTLLNRRYRIAKVSFAFIRSLCESSFRVVDGRVFLS